MLIKVKPDGSTVFELAWGTTMGYRGNGNVSTEDSGGDIYTANQQLTFIPSYCGPGIIKTSATGQPLFYQNLVDTATIGGASTINWFQDSTLVLGIGWKQMDTLGATFNIGVMKTDSFGNTIKYKQLIFDGEQAFNDADVTFDNKLIIVNSDYYLTNIITKAFKLNSDLEYDSIYTTPFTYDSLCPYPIISDTIPLDDCEVVIVGIDEAMQDPETTKLHVYPNPAASHITIEMPKYLVRKSGSHPPSLKLRRARADEQAGDFGITATTIYHQWKEIRLEVFDLFGRLMYSEVIPQLEKSVELDVSAWPEGLYVARMVFMNEVVGSVKFVVN